MSSFLARVKKGVTGSALGVAFACTCPSVIPPSEPAALADAPHHAAEAAAPDSWLSKPESTKLQVEREDPPFAFPTSVGGIRLEAPFAQERAKCEDDRRGGSFSCVAPVNPFKDVAVSTSVIALDSEGDGVTSVIVLVVATRPGDGVMIIRKLKQRYGEPNGQWREKRVWLWHGADRQPIGMIEMLDLANSPVDRLRLAAAGVTIPPNGIEWISIVYIGAHGIQSIEAREAERQHNY